MINHRGNSVLFILFWIGIVGTGCQLPLPVHNNIIYTTNEPADTLPPLRGTNQEKTISEIKQVTTPTRPIISLSFSNEMISTVLAEEMDENEKVIYRFSAEAGQKVQIQFSASSDTAYYQLVGLENEQTYKSYAQSNRQEPIYLNETQFYELHISSSDEASTYTLTVTLMPFEASLPETKQGVIDWLVQAKRNELEQAKLSPILQGKRWLEDPSHWYTLPNGDWAITLTELNGNFWQSPPGDLVIIGEAGHLFSYSDWQNITEMSAPLITHILPFSGNDETLELVVKTGSCGAHTCSYLYDVIENSADGYEVLQVAPPSAEDRTRQIWMTSSDLAIQPWEGRSALYIHGGFINSVGAGRYQRGYTNVWIWDETSNKMTLVEQRKDESVYRFDNLHDGNDAYSQQKWFIAQKIYTQVLEDETLEDIHGINESAEAIRNHTMRYAMFRLMLVALHQDNEESAEGWNQALQTEYPNHILAQASAYFLDTYTQTDDWNQTCLDVLTMLVGTNPTGELADMGYNVPSLSAETVCPAYITLDGK